MTSHDRENEAFHVGRTSLAGATILSPSAALTFETCGELRAALEEASGAPKPRVVLDLRAVALMDSEALELLVAFHERLRAKQGELRLVHLNDVCSDILTVSRLVHTLVVREEIGQALKDE